MFEMDLRKLYEVLLASNHIRQAIRVNIKNKSYVLHYEIHNKILTFRNIKKVSNSAFRKKKSISTLCCESWSSKSSRFKIKSKSRRRPPTADETTQTSRIPSSNKRLQTECRYLREVVTQTVVPVPTLTNRCSQTPIKTFKNEETSIEPLPCYSKCEQTSINVYSQGSQTEALKATPLSSMGVQTRSQTSNVANQTEENYCRMATQTMNLGTSIESQTEEMATDLVLPHRNDEIFKALECLGDAIVKQNHKFECLSKSIDELYTWITCFQKFFKRRKNGLSTISFCTIPEELPSKNNAICKP